MSSLATRLHQLFSHQPRLKFPFDDATIPKNGIYIIFEAGESFQNMDRIVRIGTHTGSNQLPSRLKQHFIKPNKNRSIFRKNIGRCFLNRDNQNYLPIWELDPTPRAGRDKKLQLIDQDYEKQLEEKISDYIQNNLSFCVFEVSTKEERLFWESRLISTLAQSDEIKPSTVWLGNHSTRPKITKHGLWQVNELNKAVLTEAEFTQLEKLVKSSN